MKVLPLHPDLKAYLKARRVEKKFLKQLNLLKENPFHPSLRTELLEPRKMKIWSFRIDKKYRDLIYFYRKGCY